MQHELLIEPDVIEDTSRCECCGNVSRKAWGSVYCDGEIYAAYSVHWTRNHVLDRGAHFDLIIGEWGDDTSASDRNAVSLEHRVLENGPAVMVIDASSREIADNDLVGTALDREDIIDSPFARDVFELYDVIMAQDERLKEILCGWVMGG